MGVRAREVGQDSVIPSAGEVSDKGLTGNVVGGQIPVRSLKVSFTEMHPLVFILSLVAGLCDVLMPLP